MQASNEDDDDEDDADTDGGIGIVHHEHTDYEVMTKRLRDFDDQEIEEEAKRRRKSTPPPKKLNNEQWDLMFDRLVKYKEDHGDCLVPKRYTEDPKLGTWVETQRVQYKKLHRETEGLTPNNRLNTERLLRLEGIGFCWSAKNLRKTKPVLMLTPASIVIKEETDTSLNFDASQDFTLTSSQRPALKQARQRLNDAQWNEMYMRLAEYKEKYGDTLVPKKYESDPKLGTWVETQRVLYNREQKEEGWDASATPEDAAEVAATMAEAAMEVVDQVVTNTEDEDGGDVEVDDDTKLPLKRLTEDRKFRLDQLGFVWSLRSKRVDDHWDDMFRQLCDYKERHGDCLVPSRYEENFKLGKWVETQRYEYTKLQRASIDLLPEDMKKSINPRLTEERRRRLEDIGFEWKVKHKMKRYYDRQWDTMLEKLLKFRDDNGHCLVPKRYPPDFKLGTWVHTQRIQYRKLVQGSMKKEDEEELLAEEALDEGKDDEQSFRLTDDRRQRLEDAGFVWSARDSEKPAEPSRVTRNSYDDQWDSMFARLALFKEKHGDCLVPKRCKEDPRLGTWVDTQRVQYKKMRKQLAKEGIEYSSPHDVDNDEEPDSTASRKPLVGRLTDDRIRRLETLGFIWSLRDDWQKHYHELVEYKKENGHCNVPARYAKNRRLGIWVSAQRQQYKIIMTNQHVDLDQRTRRSAPLNQDRIDLLNGLNFTWTIRSRDSLGESWNQRFEELKHYKEQYGHCLVPSRYPPNPELGIWVGTQRTQYRIYLEQKRMDDEGTSDIMLQQTSMNDERVLQLEELGFVWALRSGPDTSWRKRFHELIEFRDLHQHSQVPGNYPANPRLGEWASCQRESYRLRAEGKESSLDDERINELDTIGFSWDEPTPEVAAEVDRVAAEAHIQPPLEYDDLEGPQEVSTTSMEQYDAMGDHDALVSVETSHADHDSLLVDDNGQSPHEL